MCAGREAVHVLIVRAVRIRWKESDQGNNGSKPDDRLRSGVLFEILYKNTSRRARNWTRLRRWKTYEDIENNILDI
jgi:hypothetical protein